MTRRGDNRTGDNGGRETTDMLVEQYGASLYRFIHSMTNDRADTQDIMQETFIRAMENTGERREHENTGAWLHKIAYRICLNWLRSQKRRIWHERKSVETETGRAGAFRGCVETEVLQNERAEAVRAAVRNLPEKQRTAIALFNWSGMKISGIAEVMGCSEGAVMSHLHRARASLREFLKMNFSNWETEL